MLRRGWAGQLAQASRQLATESWQTLGLKSNAQYVSVFNPLSFTNDVLVTTEAPASATSVRRIVSSLRTENGRRQLTFLAPRVPPFGFREFLFETKRPAVTVVPPFSVGSNLLEGPFCRVRVDPKSGGVASLAHKASGQELLAAGSGRTLCQTVFFDDQEHTMTGVQCQSRFDACTAAVLRPAPQPDGDLLPGSDTRRFAVQGFVDCSPAGRVGVTIAPLDAYVLRLDQGAIAFEALGNDQNWKEVTRDQDGERHFRFRYSLRAHSPGYNNNAAALVWSRTVAAPLVVATGRLPGELLNRAHLAIDPAQALVTCFKPADDATPNKMIVRVWKTSDATGPVTLLAPSFRHARDADLLEREGEGLPMQRGTVSLAVLPIGFTGLALEP